MRRPFQVYVRDDEHEHVCDKPFVRRRTVFQWLFWLEPIAVAKRQFKNSLYVPDGAGYSFRASVDADPSGENESA
jgi:hypothetical protein